MSGSVNKAIIIGNLGKDPESRSMNNGGEVVSFSVATSERWKDKQSGEMRDKTEWHNVVIFNENLGNIAKQYLRKGSTVYIEGAMQTRKWTDQSGNDRYTTEIVLQKFRGELTLLGGKGDASERPAQKTGSAAQSDYGADSFDTDLDDDVPFISCDYRLDIRVS